MPINNKKDAKLLNEEWEARRENRLYDVKRSIRERTMTRKSYTELHHHLREFFWNLKHNRFCGTWAEI